MYFYYFLTKIFKTLNFYLDKFLFLNKFLLLDNLIERIGLDNFGIGFCEEVKNEPKRSIICLR